MNTTPTEQTGARRSTFGPSATVITEEQALFTSVRSALAFAYSIQQFDIAATCTLGQKGGGGGRLQGLTAHEKHAQGALIRRAVASKLSERDLCAMFAFYGTGKARQEGVRDLTRRVKGCVKISGLGGDLAHRYFAHNKEDCATQAQLADFYEVSQQSISRMEGVVTQAIDRIRYAIEAEMEAMFVATGIAQGT